MENTNSRWEAHDKGLLDANGGWGGKKREKTGLVSLFSLEG